MKKSWIILGSIFSFIILAIGLFFIEESYTNAMLHGDVVTNATIYEEYQDLGFDLFHNNKLIDKDLYKYSDTNNVDYNKLGEYKVTYDIKYHLRKFHLERVVNVVDNVKPVITIEAEKIERDYCTKKDKKELKYEAKDNYDGDLTDKIIKTEDENNVILSVSDTSDNK